MTELRRAGRVVASIEARMRSSRLPGKVLADIAGTPLLGWMVERLRRTRSVDAVVIATSTGPTDDAVASWAEGAGVTCHRGSEEDVLDRVVQAQRGQASDIVVELCGDCPLIDPALVDRAVEAFRAGAGDIVTSAWHQSYPQGTEVQVFGLADLEEVARTVSDPAVREHVSLYFYEHPERYRRVDLQAPAGLRRPDYRLQVDYPEDLELNRSIHATLLARTGRTFGLPEVVALLDADPALAALNADCEERAAR